MKNGLALCAVVLFLPSVAFGQSSALQLTQRIALPNVDGRMDHMGVDTAGQRLFATAFDNHTLSVIDLKAGRQVSLIPNLDKPQAAYLRCRNQSPLRLRGRRWIGEDVRRQD